jgi:PAP2 superfamily
LPPAGEASALRSTGSAVVPDAGRTHPGLELRKVSRACRGAVDGPGRCRRMRHAGTDDASDASPVEQADIAATRQLARHHHDPGLLAGDHGLACRGMHLVASVALATLLKGTVKRALSRTRPNVLLDEGLYRVKPLGPDVGPWHSFPSGHTTGAVALARAVVRCWPAARWPAYAGAAAVGLVQVPRGAHYPSDVLAGVVVGVVAEVVVHRLFPALAATPDR